jgi:hypothetical protein
MSKRSKRRTAHVLRSARSGQWIVRTGGRVASSHQSRSDALAAASSLPESPEIVVHPEPDSELSASPLGALAGDVDFGAGTRTTLRVPDAVSDAADRLAVEIGTTRNDAIVRLALTGARVAARAREVAEKRDARWHALLSEAVPDAPLPDAEEMRAVSFALRDGAE